MQNSALSHGRSEVKIIGKDRTLSVSAPVSRPLWSTRLGNDRVLCLALFLDYGYGYFALPLVQFALSGVILIQVVFTSGTSIRPVSI
jgi:hypothetical protein